MSGMGLSAHRGTVYCSERIGRNAFFFPFINLKQRSSYQLLNLSMALVSEEILIYDYMCGKRLKNLDMQL